MTPQRLIVIGPVQTTASFTLARGCPRVTAAWLRECDLYQMSHCDPGPSNVVPPDQRRSLLGHRDQDLQGVPFSDGTFDPEAVTNLTLAKGPRITIAGHYSHTRDDPVSPRAVHTILTA